MAETADCSFRSSVTIVPPHPLRQFTHFVTIACCALYSAIESHQGDGGWRQGRESPPTKRANHGRRRRSCAKSTLPWKRQSERIRPTGSGSTTAGSAVVPIPIRSSFQVSAVSEVGAERTTRMVRSSFRRSRSIVEPKSPPEGGIHFCQFSKPTCRRRKQQRLGL